MKRIALWFVLPLVIAGCDDSTSTTPAAVNVVQLTAGDSSCPYGGAAFTSGGTTAYACSGGPGIQGVQGIQGIQGLPGAPAPYQSRADVYCDSVSPAVDDTNSVLIASCRSVQDLPLSGSCEQRTFSDAALAWNGPNGWYTPISPPGSKAEYWCGWYRGDFGYLPVNTIPTALATICCIAVP